jgi:uncharacterized protein (DUF39 family)
VFGQQYWMECSSYQGCTEWWRGTVPAHQREKITIPVNTNPGWSGEFPGAFVIDGVVNGQTVHVEVTAKTK